MVERLIKFITKEEFSKIFSAEKDRKFKLAYLLGFGSGLRISEIVGYKGKSKRVNKKTGEIIEKDVVINPLQQENINLQEHQIRIIGKGFKERITITPKNLTEAHLKMLPLKINRRTLQRRFSNLCNKVLGKKLNFHTLRHGFANYLVNEKKIPLPMVQSFLGHSRLDVTGIYTKSNPFQAIKETWEAF